MIFSLGTPVYSVGLSLDLDHVGPTAPGELSSFFFFIMVWRRPPLPPPSFLDLPSGGSLPLGHGPAAHVPVQLSQFCSLNFPYAPRFLSLSLRTLSYCLEFLPIPPCFPFLVNRRCLGQILEFLPPHTNSLPLRGLFPLRYGYLVTLHGFTGPPVNPFSAFCLQMSSPSTVGSFSLTDDLFLCRYC